MDKIILQSGKGRYASLFEERQNRFTSRLPCYYLERTCAYSISTTHRLLGHYRLFHLYKKNCRHIPIGYHMVQGYILQYRSAHFLKIVGAHILTVFINILSAFHFRVPPIEIEHINRILLNQAVHILIEFLETADTDFEAAMDKALAEIHDPSFLAKYSGKPAPASINIQINHNVQVNNNNYYTTTYSQTHTHTWQSSIVPSSSQPEKNEKLTGKSKDVFSKRQICIIFDLFHEAGKLNKLDFKHPRKRLAAAKLLHALTGKPTESILQAMKDFNEQGLYAYHTEGEFRQLISTLTNAANIFREADLKDEARLFDKKIITLEQIYNRGLR